ncbi:MAG: GNAT family N-acetyltransferase [Pseudomonadota bacterium]
MKIFDLKDCPQHIPQLAAWHHVEWSDMNPGQTLKRRVEKMQQYLKDDFVPSTYVAIKADQLVGSAAIVEYDMKIKGCTPWLASVYVDKTYRNKGVGSGLVTHAMQQAKLNKVDTLYLFTPDRADFYLYLGWQVKSIEPYYGNNVTIMYYNTFNQLAVESN